MRPVAWSSSYLFRWPFGISTVTSNCTRLVCPTATPRNRRRSPFLGVGTIASSGSTIVTAKTGRFRRRIAMGVIGLVLLLIGGGGGGGLLLPRGRGGGAGPEAFGAPDAELPDLGGASPVLASLGTDAPAPDPAVLTSQLTPLLTSAGLGTGVSAEVGDVPAGAS